jgi:hypothetical protein
MAPGKPTLDNLIADRDSTSDSLDYVKTEMDRHAAAPLTEDVCDMLLGMVNTSKTDLLEVQKKIRHLQPADIDAHKAAFQALMSKSTEYQSFLHGIKIRFPVQPSASGAVHPPPPRSTDVRLPQLDIPQFDGTLLEWVSFRDIFISTVGNSTVLSDANKLAHLKSLLTGEAARLVKSLILSDANYHIAWNTLNNRYNNDREFMFAIYNRLYRQPFLQQSSSTNLRTLVDVTQECIRSLSIIGVPLDKGLDTSILYHLTCKLDQSSRELWEQSLKDATIPKLEDLINFVEQRARGLAAGATTKPRPQRNMDDDRKPVRAHHAQSSSKCKVCSAQHPIYKCEKFLNFSVDDKVDAIKKNGLCFNCLQSGHSTRTCTSTGRCRHCKEKHHSFIHRPRDSNQGNAASTSSQPHQSNNPSSGTSDTKDSFHTVDMSSVNQTMLATAVIKICDNQGEAHLCRALLDSGSTASFITDACVVRLGLQRKRSDVEVTGLASTAVSRATSTTIVSIRPHFKSSDEFIVNALVLPKVTGRLPTQRHDPSVWSHLKGLQLADPRYHIPANVDILLGADIFFNILLDGRKTASPDQPIGIRSSLGWLIAGNLNSTKSTVRVHHSDTNLDQLLTRFWEVETIEESRKLTAEEQSCEDHFLRTHQREPTGRFIVRLPWKAPRLQLGPTRDLALRRLKQLERRLDRNPQYKDQYIEFMREYEALGHMSLVSPILCSTKQYNSAVAVPDSSVHLPYFIPHHFVLKSDSTTTKLRVVFDASAKTASGFSLNDAMMVGPVVQDSLIDIIMRFRLHQIAFTGDIAKMYRQILVHDEDTKFQHILWRENPTDAIREYRLNTVTYGTAAAPYLATRTLQQLAIQEEARLPEAAVLIKRDMYVDDLMSGAATLTEAIAVKDQLLHIMESAGLHLRKWSSNCQELLDSLPADHIETMTMMPIEDGQSVKALGIVWNTTKDQFQFKTSIDSDSSEEYTKRTILSEMSRLFDPLGWLSPVLVRAKILMQSLWQSKLGWDQPVEAHLALQWINFKQDFKHLTEIKIPRCIIPPPTTHLELAGFSDASERAFGAVIYLVSYQDTQPHQISLVTSKTRVAPLKPQSIPRLELNAAVQLAQLICNVKKALQLDFRRIRCWTDSTIVHCWIRKNPALLKPYVANRVIEILSHVAESSWYHVRGLDNPADIPSRGLTVKEIATNSLWWNGPVFLQQDIDEQSTTPIPSESEAKAIQLEERKEVTAATAVTKIHSLPLLEKISSLRKLLRITGWIRRFIHNYLHPTYPTIGPLTADELQQAKLCWIRRVQQQEFGLEIQTIRSGKELPSKNRILSLKPFICPESILRVGGRLRHSNLPADQRNPILLPTHSRLTKLIIDNQHITELHAGPQLVLSTLQQQYWIVRGRDAVRHQIKKCVTCRRHSAVTMQQQMGDLPSARVNPGRPFQKCGVDYAGPFLLRPIPSRSKVTYKAYLCIIICFVTKAIHLEVVSSLSTDAFIASLRRFVSRRGKPSDIFSDCGTNFIGADRQLKEMAELIKSDPHNNKIADRLSGEGISWHFNPPGAPHFGGLWEAGVKSVKYHLYRVVGPNRLTYEEMTTVMHQIEACLNSRPLTQLSSAPEDLTALTPGHFLIGSPLNALPDPDLSAINIGRLDRWQLLQRLQQQFWKRWSNEFLSRLQQRPKWLKQRDQPQLNDLVLIKDENLPPMKWKLARIIQLHPGADNLTRVATIKTAAGEMTRPISKLCLLPINSNDESDDQF